MSEKSAFLTFYCNPKIIVEFNKYLIYRNLILFLYSNSLNNFRNGKTEMQNTKKSFQK